MTAKRRAIRHLVSALIIAVLITTSVPAYALPAPAAAKTDQKPKSWAIATAETLMKRNPGTPQDRLARWSYWKGYTLNGFEMLWRSTGDQRYFDFIKRQLDPFIDEKGHLVNVKLNSLDNVMAGNMVVALYEYTRDERYRIAAAEIRQAFDTYPRNQDGGFWHNPKMPGQMWIDGVFMGQMFLLRYGKSIGDREYCFAEAVKQITIFANHGRKGDTGLYYHAWAEQPEKTKWADPATGLSSDVWSEGLGWYALILVETLSVLPQDHPGRAAVLDIFTRLAAGLKSTQDPKTGRWFQVVDKGNEPGNWTDTSGSAMFTYALQRGIELGLLKKKAYAPVVAKGFRGIVASARLNEDGLVDLSDACDGVNVQENYSKYINHKKTMNAKEAVAGFLWAAAIVERPALEKQRKRGTGKGLLP
jgi:rhamnogalacturonyl hydrolase YesR